MTRADLWNLTDVDLLARLIYGEARGEDHIGKVAVGYVVLNRVKADLNHDGKSDWWGEGLAGVILKNWQFSCLNENDPNLGKILALDYDHPDNVFDGCIKAARVVLSGFEPDPTFGADSYHTLNILPKWASSSKITARIGHHIFYHIGNW